MSLASEMLDRLSGVAVVRERLGETSQRVERLAEQMLDHERRIVRLETVILELPSQRGGKPRRA